MTDNPTTAAGSDSRGCSGRQRKRVHWCPEAFMASTRDEPDQYLHAAAEPTPQARSLDFSLVLGGPLFQIFRRLHLQGQEADLLPRRLLSITAIAWLPLLLINLLT